MVKANAYNHGLAGVIDISNTIVDRYGVATLDEAIKIRKLGVAKPITLFSFESKDILDVIKYNITPVVYNEQTLNAVLDEKYHNFDIKIDTGMNRYGYKSKSEISSVIRYLSNINFIPRAIHSHFYSVESMLEQMRLFDNIVTDYLSVLSTPKKIVSASLGINNGLYLDGVRLGLGAYLNALEVSSDILSIKNVHAYEKVGYDGYYVPTKNTKIAIISGGYYDGIRRSYRGAKVLVNGYYATIVGRVCMDVTLVDIGDIQAKIGDRAVIINPHTLNSYIDKDNSSEYEVITAINGRGKRIYLYNGQNYNKIVD